MSISRILQLAGLERIDESVKTEVPLEEGFGFLRSLIREKAADKTKVKELSKTSKPADKFDKTKVKEISKKKVKENADTWMDLAKHAGWLDNCMKLAKLFNLSPQEVWEVKCHMHDPEFTPHGTMGKAVEEYIDRNSDTLQMHADATDDEPGEDDVFHNGFWIDAPPEKDLGFN